MELRIPRTPPPRPGRAVRRARAVTRHNPRVFMAVKAACAAAIAWLVVQPFGGFVHQYPYYAPLGAAVAMSTTVADSVRYTLQSVLAILIGAALALLVRAAPVSELGGIAFVTGAGTLLAGWTRLGAMGGWVPIAGLFVLILGGDQPWHYVAAYGGLTGVGAAIGVVVNAALPQLPLAPATRAQAHLRHLLADALDELADGLVAEDQLSSGTWESVARSLDPQLRQVEALLDVGMDARRANWRAGRWTELADRRHRQGRALRRLAGCVEEVVALASAPDGSMHASDDLGADLRSSIATALTRTAAMIREVDEDDAEAGREEREQALEAIDALRATVAGLPHHPRGRGLDAGAIAVGLEQAVGVWE